MHLDPAPHWPDDVHNFTGCEQALVGSPVRPAGHEHRAWWLLTLHRALLPHEVVEDVHGLVHWLLIQAWSAGQLEEDLHPRTQVTPLQIS